MEGQIGKSKASLPPMDKVQITRRNGWKSRADMLYRYRREGGGVMGLMSWWFGRGLPGAISKDLIVKYLGIKQQHPTEEEKKILERIWSLYLTLNEGPIYAEDGTDKIARLELRKEEHDPEEGSVQSVIRTWEHTLMSVYLDVLYIETDISTMDGKLFGNALKVFVDVANKYGLDFSEEYEGWKRTMGRLGRRM